MGPTGVNHNWTAAEDALLGKMSDGEAARRIGLTPLSIFRRRTKLGIPAYKPPIPKPRKKLAVRRAKSKPWTSAEVSLLGTDTDRAIGARLGLTREAVQRERRLRKIPAISDRRPRIKSWGTIEVLLFDQYSDAEIAKLLRRDLKDVTALRRKLRKRTQ